ncbi:MAG: protein-L-isoaspartate(D-aspartate) O-methyltransferase, partial [Planctomycetota bacterium]
SAAEVIKDLKLENVHTRVGDGFKGWPEAAPFDKIIVTCSPEKVPQPLIDQLVEGGMMIVPVGERYQQTMYRMIKKDGKLERQALRPTLFVPMTGAAEASRERLPDPKNPRLINGDFSQAPPAGATNQVDFVPGWYYGRQVKRIEDSLSHAPYVRFENETPGLSSHLLQGIAIDGTSVGTIRLATRYRSDGVRRGDEADQLPAIVISFYDGVRADLGAEMIGPFRNSRSWRDASRLIRVPPRAREAIVRIGLFGATGVIEFDDVELKKVGD